MGDDIEVRSGMSAEQKPYPSPELNIGNTVRLKEPYVVLEDGRSYSWGVIVEHPGRNFAQMPKLGLHLYSDDGHIHLDRNHIPAVTDLPAYEVILWHLIGTIGYEPVAPKGHDLYPKCPGCGNAENQHPFGDNPCPQCEGWGYVKHMVRLPLDAPKG